jgi:uncharacterized repeat protein (TIGR01451 family)
MKKLVLFLVLLFTSSILFSQTLNQPNQFNNVCDDNNDGYALFYMQEIAFEIVGNNQNLVVSHHLTQADAANNVNPLPFNYVNQVTGQQLVFARVVNTVTNQVQIMPYTLHVNPIPNVMPYTISVCDDNNDGYTTIDLNPTIPFFSTEPGIIVSFHETLTDAYLGSNPLSSPYMNLVIPYEVVIYVRILNPATGCYAVTQLYVFITNCGTGQSGQPQDLYACSNGTSACFNLIPNNQNIIGTLNPSDYQITYHASQIDAEMGQNPISTPSDFCTSSSITSIYARLLNIQNNTVETFVFNLVVSIPPPAPTQTITSCANNGQCWDLTSVIPNILNGQNCEVAFFLTQADAVNFMNPIANPSCFESILGSPTQPPLYYSVVCTNLANCVSLGIVQLITTQCYTGGQPQNLTACADTGGFACVDLTINDALALGNLDPATNTVSYYINQIDAATGTNPMSSPFCPPFGTYTLYSRVASNNGENYFQTSFEITTASYQNSSISLPTIVQCDDNNNGLIIWDLTVVQAQLNTSNPLSYYTTIDGAQNMTNPIANPAAWTTNIQFNLIPIYIREVVAGGCDLIHLVQLQGLSNCNVASTCSLANSLCNSLGEPFANTINVGSAGSYGCLFTTPNPTWFYLPISQNGPINLIIEQNSSINFTGTYSDADFVLFGPFSDPVSPCASQLTSNNIVSCSYSANATEYPSIPNAQAGQYYLLMVTNFSNQPGFIRISQLGTSQGVIDCSGLRLNAFLDSNNNGSQDNGEQNFPLGQFHYERNNNGVIHNIIAPTGTHNIYDINASNTYDVSFSVDSSYAAMYAVSPSSYSDLNVVIGSGLITYNFPVTVVQSYNDLAVTIVPLSAPRPGFTYQNKIIYTNLGNQNVASGTLTFTKDTNVTITANTQSGTTPTATGFTYNFSNLAAFETRSMTVTMQVPTIPTVTAGQYLTNSATIEPLTGDVVPENNASTSSQMVINAYDPNDKMESRGPQILFSTFTPNDYLYYTIRFENTGNASAINVSVKDVLDAQLDESSIKMVSASHPYEMDRVGNNLTWKFDNIQLPVSIANTNIGKGYITFKVKPKAGYAVGDSITNSASIYFDFNPAIVTNMFSTQFVAALAVNEFENGDFVFYPNPTSGIVTVSLKNTENSIASIAVYDILGKTIMTKNANDVTTQTIDLSGVQTGMYFIEVTTNTNLKVIKKLMVK